MTDAEVDQLEAELGISLPGEYRKGVTDHPLPDSDVFGNEFCGVFDDLLRENKYLRDMGFFDTEWNPAWFVIGLDGCGNNFFITTQPFDGRVYFADHEGVLHTDDLSRNENYASFEAFFEFLREIDDDIKEDEAREEHRIRNRKWWQFWVPKASPKNGQG